MPLIEQLLGILRKRRLRGERSVPLSPANLALLGRVPQTKPQQPSAAAPVPRPPVSVPRPPAGRPPFAMPPAQTAAQTIAVPTPIAPVASFPPPPSVAGSSWEELCQACLDCHSCGLCQTRRHVVIEDGCRAAPLMFIGEGPGEDEDAQGVPFVGRAGQLLTRMIAAMKRDRASQEPSSAVYIANIVKCRPPNNRNPLPEEGNACLGYLRRQIALVQPKVIVLLGAVPLQFLLGRRGITSARGKWLDYEGIPVMPTFHPAFVLRFERYPQDFLEKKRLVWHDLQAVMKRLQE